jgi:hypothetical protein
LCEIFFAVCFSVRLSSRRSLTDTEQVFFNDQIQYPNSFATDVQTHDRASLHDLDCINRANLSAGVALNAKIGNDFMLFVRLKQDGFNRTFLGAFGTADAQIIDLILNQILAFA